MKRPGIPIVSKKKVRKSVAYWVEEIKKAGTHKYVKREGSPGNYKYYYRLPDGSLGSKEELEAANKGKVPQAAGGKPPAQSSAPSPKGTKEQAAEPKQGASAGGNGGNVHGGGDGLGANQYAGSIAVGGTITGADAYTGNTITGKVQAKGRDGITVVDEKNIPHHIPWNGIQEEKQPNEGSKEKRFIPPEKFSAADFAKQWDDPLAIADEAGKEHILKSFGAEGEVIANGIRDADSKNKRLIENKQLTHQLYRIAGEGESARYTPEREKLHGKITQDLLAPDKLRAALPPPGQKPKFIILGGRGGSGKSWFRDNIYDPNTTVVLDADEIKSMLPEYKGWNANQVHEESSDILEQMIAKCIRDGLNIVLDATMKTADSALAKVFRFKSAGYKTEAHYMHLPKQEAAKRAIGRFKGSSEKGKKEEFLPFKGRYVPVTAVLKNTTNEDSFDQVRRIVDEWSFRDNNVKRGEQPILISEGKKEVKKSFVTLEKNMIKTYN